MPQISPLISAKDSPIPRQSDVWHYYYSRSNVNSTERILGISNCSGVECFIDNEITPAYNDTRWIDLGNWSLVREYCTGCEGVGSVNSSYEPARQLYRFPLGTADSWWWNGTVLSVDSNGNVVSSNASILSRVVNETSVTVPGGTFDAFLVAEYGEGGSVLLDYSWFSLQAETAVKVLMFDGSGGVRDSRELVSYQIVAVNSGDYVRLGDIVDSYRSNDPNEQLSMSPLRDTKSIATTVLNVNGSAVDLNTTSLFNNGTSLTFAETMDLSNATQQSPTFGPFIIDAGLRTGDSIPNWQGMSINYTRSISYLGTSREVSVLNVTRVPQGSRTGWIRLVRFWDRATGFLLAMRTDTNSTYLSNGYTYSAIESTSVRVVSTSLWNGFMPGVRKGEWVKYGEFSASWASNVPGDIDTVRRYEDISWQVDTIGDTSGYNVTIGSVVVSTNSSSSRSLEVWGDTRRGSGDQTGPCPLPCVIAANLRMGDPIFDPVYSQVAPTVNRTIDKVYMGVKRHVNILNITSNYSGLYTGSTSSLGLYDQATGILLEYFFQDSARFQNYTRTASAHLRVTETNLWTPTKLPDFSLRGTPKLLALQPGASGRIIVTLTGTRGFADTVFLVQGGPPSGLTVGPVPDSLTITGSPNRINASFPMSVSTGSDIPAGSFNLTITGISGSIAHLAVLPVLVFRAVQIECGIRDLCSLTANVTISEINSGGRMIHFAAIGPNDIIGYANLTIPMRSLPSLNDLAVSVDKVQLPQSEIQITLDSKGADYLVYFTFVVHGPVNVDISLGSLSQQGSSLALRGLDPTTVGVVGILILVIASVCVEAVRGVGRARGRRGSLSGSGAKGRKPRWLYIDK